MADELPVDVVRAGGRGAACEIKRLEWLYANTNAQHCVALHFGAVCIVRIVSDRISRRRIALCCIALQRLPATPSAAKKKILCLLQVWLLSGVPAADQAWPPRCGAVVATVSRREQYWGGRPAGQRAGVGGTPKKKEHWVLQAPCKDSHQTHEHATRNPCPKLGEPNVFFFVLGFFFCFKARLQRWLEDIGAAVTLGDYRHAREDEDSLDKHFFIKKI